MQLAVQFEAEPGKITIGITSLMGQLKPHVKDVADLGTIELVIAEVLNNITEHAYSDQGFGVIEGQFEVQEGKLSVHLHDHGKPMPGLELPKGKLADLNVDLQDLPEGGFGWYMIRQLTQGLTYRRLDDQNHLSFEIELAS
ncbi:ATP-binding protein [Algirhabdus cladophorae]|uniref:ATP-binding protein n=1 Tax=Algirhabdus cladophorae TaxID=3377108 RepID=UPI003B84B439